LRDLATHAEAEVKAIDDKALLVMRRLVAITLQDVSNNPRKGRSANAKKKEQTEARPKWLYLRKKVRAAGAPADPDPVAVPLGSTGKGGGKGNGSSVATELVPDPGAVPLGSTGSGGGKGNESSVGSGLVPDPVAVPLGSAGSVATGLVPGPDGLKQVEDDRLLALFSPEGEGGGLLREAAPFDGHMDVERRPPMMGTGASRGGPLRWAQGLEGPGLLREAAPYDGHEDLQWGLFSPGSSQEATGEAHRGTEGNAAVPPGPLDQPSGPHPVPPESDGVLPRAGFATQAAWHLEVARRALRAKGHRFAEEGSGSVFDPTALKPAAPQCELCLVVFPKARIHTLAKTGGVCVPVACTVGTPLTKPQRLVPRRVLLIGTSEVHDTHSLGHYRGRLWCFGCAATMAVTSRVTTALVRTCPERCEDTARRNLLKLAEGELPKAWQAAGWPKGPCFRLLGFS
jgi:hypothetical protein